MTKTTEQHIANLIAQSYIEVMGKENWDSKTPKEQHDIIMILLRDALKALEAIETHAE